MGYKKELKGFQKQWIEPGESKVFRIELDEHAFAFYHIGEGKWMVESGEYEIKIGASSRDIRLFGSITVDGNQFENPYAGQKIGPYLTGNVQDISSADYAALYGDPMPEAFWNRKANLGMNDTIGQGTYKSNFGRFINWLMMAARRYFIIRKKPIQANNIYFGQNLTYRQAYRFSMGKVKKRTMKNVLTFINHGLIRGLLTLAKNKDEREPKNVQ